jgi:uncharacterized OsmC-like protein
MPDRMTPIATLVNGINVDDQADVVGALSSGPTGPAATAVATTVWRGGTQTRSTVSIRFGNPPTAHREGAKFVLESDQPQTLLGSGRAASPIEMLLASIGSSFATSFVLAASKRQTRIEAIEVHAEADVDVRPMLGPPDSPTAEPISLRLSLHVEADADPDTLRELAASAAEDSLIVRLCRETVRMVIEGTP